MAVGVRDAVAVAVGGRVAEGLGVAVRVGVGVRVGSEPGQPVSARLRAVMISSTVTLRLPSASMASHSSMVRRPSAMLRPVSTSSTVTSPSTPQSPMQGCATAGAAARHAAKAAA